MYIPGKIYKQEIHYKEVFYWLIYFYILIQTEHIYITIYLLFMWLQYKMPETNSKQSLVIQGTFYMGLVGEIPHVKLRIKLCNSGGLWHQMRAWEGGENGILLGKWINIEMDKHRTEPKHRKARILLTVHVYTVQYVVFVFRIQ